MTTWIGLVLLDTQIFNFLPSQSSNLEVVEQHNGAQQHLWTLLQINGSFSLQTGRNSASLLRSVSMLSNVKLINNSIAIQIGWNIPKDHLAMQIYTFVCQLNTRCQHIALVELINNTKKVVADMEAWLESRFSLSQEQKVRPSNEQSAQRLTIGT